MTRQIFTALIFAIAMIAATHNCLAQTEPKPPKPLGEPHDHSHQSNAADDSVAHKYFTDVELINQDGKKVRFYTDVLKGKTVVINAFFTSCTSVCPPMNRNMERIQQALGDRVGKDVVLISISVDPEVDTPPKLKEYAKKFHAGPGWMFLTGKKENVDWALYKVGQYVEAKDDHTTIFIVGNEATGLWKKALGIANPNELVQIVESVVNDKGGTQ